MRRPKTPPQLFDEESEMSGERILELSRLVHTLKAPDRYLHWDELRHRPPPEGLDHETWWMILKLGRLGHRTWLPLKDSNGRGFHVGLHEPVLERLHFFDMRLAGTVGMPEPLASESERNRYLMSSLMEEAIRSSQLEGAVTTAKVAKEMLRTGRRPLDRSERMILNNFRAMGRIRDLEKEELSLRLVLELQQIVTEEALDDPSAAGRLRRSDEVVRVVASADGEVLHVPPPADELPERLEVMCAFANGQIPQSFLHPVIRSIFLHFWLAYDHPFVDGNGRTARALFYWSMLRHGYWLSEYISISNIISKQRSKYARAFLYTETDENDLTYFLLYHLSVIERATNALYDYLKRKTSQLKSLEVRLSARHDLNYRQRTLLSHALRDLSGHYTIRSHRRSHGVAYDTARTDLLDLVEKGFLIKQKRGREFAFFPIEDLPHLLGSGP